MLPPFTLPLNLLVFIASIVAFLVTVARYIIPPLTDPYGAAMTFLRILF